MVIGGGPGGSTAATLLAQRGHRVILLERERFPRHHVGESLLPASIPVLQDLGVLKQVENAGFPKKWGATMLWGRDPQPWSWYFRETNRSYPHAYQVSRPVFDQILLDNARANGVDVWEGHTVVDPVIVGDTVTGVTVRGPGSERTTIHSGWVVDASGQAAVLSRALGLRQWDDHFRNMAVYGYFRGVRRLPAPDETNIFIESYPDGWVWNIPLKGDVASIGVVVDSEAGQLEIANSGVEGFFQDQLHSAKHTRDMLSDAQLTSGPRVVKDWSYASTKTVGRGWILVGDAACFIDPLFSSGIHLAMMSGTMAAAYVHAAERDPSMCEPAAEVYEQLYRREYSHFRELARLFYTSNRTSESYFWEARCLVGGAVDEESRQSFIRAVAGQAPRGYERAVLDRGDIPDDFREAMRRIESKRRARSSGLDGGAVPVLADGVRLERRPIFADGDFVWSTVLVSPHRSEGIPVSSLVTALVSAIDGRTATGEIVQRLTREVAEPAARRQVAEATYDSLRILYADEMVEVSEAERGV